MYIYTFLLRMAGTMTSQNIDLSVHSESGCFLLFFLMFLVRLTLLFAFRKLNVECIDDL
jgi:hypothetical protein